MKNIRTQIIQRELRPYEPVFSNDPSTDFLSPRKTTYVLMGIIKSYDLVPKVKKGSILSFLRGIKQIISSQYINSTLKLPKVILKGLGCYEIFQFIQISKTLA